MLKPLRYIILLTLALCSHLGGQAFTVVLDAGHGGKDKGCIGKLTCEKDIVLDVTKQLGDKIKAEHPEVKVVYTRDDDRFVELQDRARIANKASGNLFISIHVNSIDAKTKGREKVNGAQVYTLGLHKSQSNLDVAMRENSVIELENDFTEKYHGFDPQSSESYIIFELCQSRHLKQSLHFSELVQTALVDDAGRADKGIRQAGFLVLWATSMPSVLVELDFICNPEAERFLASDYGRRQCADAIFKAFKTYYNEQKK